MSSVFKSVIIFFVATVFLGCGGSSSVGQSKVDPAAFDAQIKATSNPQIIDVRTPEEFNSGHISNALNLNIYDDDFDQKLDLLNKNDTIFVYCKSGGRSGDASKRLTAKGFTNVYDLAGGITSWKASNMPTEGSPKAEIVDKGQYSLANYDSVVKSQPLVVVDFYATWCGPCKQMTPYLEKLKATYPETKLKIVKIDVDQNSALSSHFKVTSIPLIKFYSNGSEFTSKLGYISEEEMMSIIKPYL